MENSQLSYFNFRFFIVWRKLWSSKDEDGGTNDV